jgi:hypothetical protein
VIGAQLRALLQEQGVVLLVTAGSWQATQGFTKDIPETCTKLKAQDSLHERLLRHAQSSRPGSCQADLLAAAYNNLYGQN